MGCCTSTEVVRLPPTMDKENNESATKECLIEMSCKVDLRLLIPDDQKVTEISDLSGHSASPTGVNQRSKKSVTFNPISTIKEYRRDSSSADKNFTTYIISQLGEDDWSDDESDGMNGSDEGDGEQSEEQEGEYEYDYACGDGEEGELELAGLAEKVEESGSEGGAGQEWRSGLDLSHERILQPGDPSYISDFDFDYAEHEYGLQGEAQSVHAQLYAQLRAGGIAGEGSPGGAGGNAAWITSY